MTRPQKHLPSASSCAPNLDCDSGRNEGVIVQLTITLGDVKVFTILHVQSFLNIKAENLIHKVKDRALSGQQLPICKQRREMHSPVYYFAIAVQFSSFVYNLQISHSADFFANAG